MATRVGCSKIRLASSNSQSPKTPVCHKDLGNISCTSRVIAHFVSNFIAMTMEVDWRRIQLAAFDGPSPKTFPIDVKISQICLT